jgi:ribonuclease HI
MKTYAIYGNRYQGIYTKPWSDVQPLTKTKPAPKYKGFPTAAAAEAWLAEQIAGDADPSRQYETAFDGKFTVKSDTYYIFTDGGNRNTGNVAGGHVKDTDKAAWAIAIYNGKDLNTPVFTDSKAYFGRTNNDMEVTALLNALHHAGRVTTPVTIVSDSKYVLDTVTDWMYNWQADDWRKSSGEIANLGSWQKAYDLVQPLRDRLTFIWVKGHATSAGNVLVDQLLNNAMDTLD